MNLSVACKSTDEAAAALANSHKLLAHSDTDNVIPISCDKFNVTAFTNENMTTL